MNTLSRIITFFVYFLIVLVSRAQQDENIHVVTIRDIIDKINQGDVTRESLSEKLDYYNYGLAYVEKLPEIHEARALLYYSYSKFLQNLGYYDEALTYGLALVAITEDENYKGEMYYVNHELGKIYLKLGKYDEAVKIEKNGLERRILLADEIDTTRTYNYLYNELGLTYFSIGLYDSAISCYDKAIESNYPFTVHYMFVLKENKAEALIMKGDVAKAQQVVEELAVHPGRYENDRRNVNYFLLMAEWNFLRSDWKEAGKNLDSAVNCLRISSEKDEPNIWKRYYTDRRQYYILKGDRNDLSDFELNYRRFQDSLSLLVDRSIVLTQNAHFNQLLENQSLRLRNAKLETDQATAQLREEELHNRNNFLMFITSILSLVIVVIVLIWLYRSYRKKVEESNRLQENLEYSVGQNKELADTIKFKDNDIQSLSNYLMGSSEQLTKLREILKKINRIEDQEEKESILLNFLVDARQKIHHLEEDKLMLEKIEDINHEFNNRLLQLHPNLTKGDLQYCGLIKAGMSNAEIAQEKNTSVNTVKTAKHRLKKKLYLSHEIKIETYLRYV